MTPGDEFPGSFFYLDIVRRGCYRACGRVFGGKIHII